jgi:hypothetical protein
LPGREARRDVQGLLFWNRFVIEDMISDCVSDGVVTLTRRVDNCSGAGAALSSAWEAEPMDIRNEPDLTRGRDVSDPIEATRREASHQPL